MNRAKNNRKYRINRKHKNINKIDSMLNYTRRSEDMSKLRDRILVRPFKVSAKVALWYVTLVGIILTASTCVACLS